MSKYSNKIPALTGVKGVAIFGVIGYHLFPYIIKGGFLWVNTFFVLAGFFIARKIETSSALSFRYISQYFITTLKRLWFPLVTVISLLLAWLLLFDRIELSYDRGDILSSLFFYNNYFQIQAGRSYFMQMAGTSPFTHLWYASLYAQGFLIALLGIALFKYFRFPAYVKASIWLILFSVSQTLIVLVYQPGGDPSHYYYALYTRFSSIAIGVALAYLIPIGLNLLHALPGKHYLLFALDLMTLLLMILLTFGAGDQSVSSYYIWLPVFSLLSAQLIFTIVAGAPVSQFILNRIPLIHVGQRSYAYYLWYYPVLHYAEKLSIHPLLRLLVIGTFLTLLAHSLYTYVEQRSFSFVQYIRTLSHGGKETWIRTMILILLLIPLIIGISMSKHNKRLALVELEYLTYLNNPNIGDTPYPGTEAIIDTIQTSQQWDARLNTHFTPIKSTNSNTTQLINRLTTPIDTKITAVIQERQAEVEAFSEEYPNLAALVGPQDILFSQTFPVTLFGDSIAFMNSSTFDAGFPNGNSYGKISLSLYNGGMEIFQEMVENGEIQENVIVQVGVNGGLDNDSLDQFIAIAGSRQIYFVTVHNSDLGDDFTNSFLFNAEKRHPNVHVLDWQTYQMGHDEWYISDGVHQTPEGALEYVGFLMRRLTQLHQP